MAVNDQLQTLVGEMHNGGVPYSAAVREFKKSYITNVLERNGGNQCKAARELGMHRNTLSRTISELDLKLSEVRAMRRPPTSARPLEMPAAERAQAMEIKAAR